MDIYSRQTYFYDLPEELIAQTPIEPRDNSRLLVYDRKNKNIEHKQFFNIIDYLQAGDVLVVNNTKVLPARLFGIKESTGARIEILLSRREDLTSWQVLLRPAKRCKVGTIVKINDELSMEVLAELDEGLRKVRFIYDGVFESILAKVGTMPLPQYIKKACENPNRYQTVYADKEGSSAAPTAGLHFTTELLEKVKAKGVQVVDVLLHVGLGTFRPVKADNILEHKMHSEYYEISEESANVINKAKAEGRRVIAVGTTSVRVIESASTQDGVVHSGSGDTNIFIYPGYKFKVLDALITNFHLPESTLIMLVSAFAGIDEVLRIYNTAVQERYRFFSFGDAMFIQ